MAGVANAKAPNLAKVQGEFLAALDLAEAARERAKKSARSRYQFTARNFEAYLAALSEIEALYSKAFAAAVAAATADTKQQNIVGVVFSDVTPALSRRHRTAAPGVEAMAGDGPKV
jgi:hypothetical protein